jgi:hypothetical protein
MATTYSLISSNVLSSSAASVTFSAIPSTYTDLVLRWSSRDSRSNTDNSIYLSFNSITTGYSDTWLRGNGANAFTSLDTGNAYVYLPFGSDASTATSNTFSSGEVYLPNYSVALNKQMSISNVTENNATTAYITAQAALLQSTATISSITMTSAFSNTFNSGSSFNLYGIKNS